MAAQRFSTRAFMLGLLGVTVCGVRVRYTARTKSPVSSGDEPTKADLFLELWLRIFQPQPESTKNLNRVMAMGGQVRSSALEDAPLSAGCGEIVRIPNKYRPQVTDDTLYVGWDRSPSASSAVTFSFEKEWLGRPSGLWELYEPAGQICEALWKELLEMDADAALAKEFMDYAISEYEHYSTGSWLFETHRATLAQIAKVRDNAPMIPFQRRDNVHQILESIHPFLESDFGPFETKAAPFYYDILTLQRVLAFVLPRLELESFPGERRVQLHVVVPIRRTPMMTSNGSMWCPATDDELLPNLKMLAVFFSDYVFLRVGFPYGPQGGLCTSATANYKCDIWSDHHNYVYTPIEVRRLTSNPDDTEKDRIVGLRHSREYGGPQQLTCDDDADCSDPFLVGYEIRKGGASYAEAVHLATQLAKTVSSMLEPSSGSVTVRHTREIPLSAIIDFVQNRRSTLTDNCFCESASTWAVRRRWSLDQTQKRRDKEESTNPFFDRAYVIQVNVFYRHLQRLSFGEVTDTVANANTWHMLVLLLCSPWQVLLDAGVRDHEQAAVYTESVHKLESLRTDAVEKLKVIVDIDDDDETPTCSAESFRKAIATYGWAVSELF